MLQCTQLRAHWLAQGMTQLDQARAWFCQQYQKLYGVDPVDIDTTTWTLEMFLWQHEYFEAEIELRRAIDRRVKAMNRIRQLQDHKP